MPAADQPLLALGALDQPLEKVLLERTQVNWTRLRGGHKSSLLHLLDDIIALVDGQSQADPQFRTNRLYTRLTATGVRRQLIMHKGYRDDELPTAETIATELVTTSYRTGVKLTKEAMDVVEARLQRLPSLGKWFVLKIISRVVSSLG